MTSLTIGILKKIIENIPEDYTVEHDNKQTISPIISNVEIDIHNKKIILK